MWLKMENQKKIVENHHEEMKIVRRILLKNTIKHDYIENEG